MAVDPSPPPLLPGTPPLGSLLAGRIVSVVDGRVRATIPDLDGGEHARVLFGSAPEAAAEDDLVRVMLDATGQPVLVAWEAA